MDIVSKINGNQVSSTEFNQIPAELENLITSSGQAVSDAILNQDTIAVSRYAANNFYIDSGAANAYILSLAASMTNPVSATVGYFVGMTIRFKAGNANTGASTVNVNSAGVKNLKKEDGVNDLTAGDIPTTKDSEFRYNGTSFIQVIQANFATTTISGTTLLPSPITIANNTTDANNDIDFSAGVFQFSDGSGQAVATAMTKRLDANWAAGSGQGGLDTGAKANSTWYHCFAIYNPTTLVSDFLFSTSPTVPTTLPSGYTKYSLIESLFTDSSGNIIPFTHYVNQFENRIILRVPVLDMNANASSTASLPTISTPLGRQVQADLQAKYFINTATTITLNGLLTSPSQADTAPTSSLFNFRAENNNSLNYLDFSNYNNFILTDTLSRVRIRSNQTTSAFNASITTNGWRR